MKEISLPETAYQVLLKESEPIKFADLFAKVCEIGELSEEEKAQFIGHFYTDLSLDGRFVALVDNTWDLRSRHTYDKVHIDVNDVYSEVDEAEQDAEDLEAAFALMGQFQSQFRAFQYQWALLHQE